MTDKLSFAAHPADKTAVIFAGSGNRISFGDLDRRANQGAHLLRSAGLRNGDVLAMCIGNCPGFFDVACAARRSGLTLVPISTKLTAGEVAFIVGNSNAKALVVSAGTDTPVEKLAAACSGVTVFTIGFESPDLRCWDVLRAVMPVTLLADGQPGLEMLYSSGTTGRPKGIVYRGAETFSNASESALRFIERIGGSAATRYLSTAPLYHTAPFAWAMAMLVIGGTTVVMEHFDPEHSLRLIQHHRIDVTQWVPTHFVRLLKLPPECRSAYDLSSLRLAVHAAAPCPVAVKREMINWWGPILLEYYGSSEQTALTIIDSVEWLAHEGSVGRCFNGKVHICDDDGRELPVGEVGVVYAEGGMDFAYLGDPDKTAAARNAAGWTTVGDIGRLDAEGYLYLTDRKHFMIISGGVNVYPQEVEDLLVMHPLVFDAAVIGMPDEDLGEIVTAVIQLINPGSAGAALADELQRWMRESLSAVKTPKRILFRDSLPRLPTGKMAKHMLKRELIINAERADRQ